MCRFYMETAPMSRAPTGSAFLETRMQEPREYWIKMRRRLTELEQNHRDEQRCVVCGQRVNEARGALPFECIDCARMGSLPRTGGVKAGFDMNRRYREIMGYGTRVGGGAEQGSHGDDD